MQMAKVVGEGAARTPGKRSLAMEAFATALRAIPTTICDNAGALLRHTPSECVGLQKERLDAAALHGE